MGFSIAHQLFSQTELNPSILKEEIFMFSYITKMKGMDSCVSQKFVTLTLH